ncbi:MAG: phosphoribosylglycinamide formyltransferase [Flammeovirgaceae bacterium]
MHIAILASGTGSNAVKIIQHVQANYAEVQLSVWSNKKDAPVLDKAAGFDVPAHTFSRAEFRDPAQVLAQFQAQAVDLIVLAGFLWLVPAHMVKAYPNRIINIHPALLPKYGGKGMYGMNVHQAVKANQETESGITIHFVNEHYDEGQVIFQTSCALQPEDSAREIAQKVLKLEHEHFPKVVERFILGDLP